MMTSKPLIPQWQTALASLHKLREPFADQSRKELRELVRKRGIITFRSERAALVAALDFFNEDNG